MSEPLKTPPLKEGWMRWVHITTDRYADPIKKKGLSYKNQGMLSSTAAPFSEKAEADDHLMQAHSDPNWDPRFRLDKGAMAVLIDLPDSLSRIHDMRDRRYQSGDIVPPEFVRAIVHGADMSVETVRESPATWSEKFKKQPNLRHKTRKEGPAESHTAAVTSSASTTPIPDVW